MDGRWRAVVERVPNSRYHAMLRLYDGANEVPVMAQPVVLSMGAVFGPQPDDVKFWEDAVRDYVDGLSSGDSVAP